MPSSVRLGVRPRAATMRSYSSGVMLCCASNSGVIVAADGWDFMVVTTLLSHGDCASSRGTLWLFQCFADRPDVFRPGAAAATDDLCPGGGPLPGKMAEFRSAGSARPAAVFGIPAFSGVGVDDDWLVGHVF